MIYNVFYIMKLVFFLICQKNHIFKILNWHEIVLLCYDLFSHFFLDKGKEEYGEFGKLDQKKTPRGSSKKYIKRNNIRFL